MTEKVIKAKDVFRFLSESREDPQKKAIETRQTEFVEIYEQYEQPKAAVQSERCLECGNPYCEWKCP
ncbi:MAG: glutamate synthase small subunit, partial [Rhodospirillaceae bacterium]|nr:glutamate synthase small subunit [Rhodospirillaceae bacterium]